ncbi:uncharacterized protein [Haliotis asinina]|uniref:uncharacterized protein n=1 Tax=Haliotis asinina TaxID=109174 RepID=UPI00353232CE
MKPMLIVAVLVCLLAVSVDGHRALTRGGDLYWMAWRSTTMCIKSAASRLSKCTGVQTNFKHNWNPGKRAEENKERDDYQLQNEDVVSAREVNEAVAAADRAGNSAGSTGSI